MRKSLFTLLVGTAFVAAPVTAQEQTPQVELYGGYNYTRFNVTANVSGFPPSATFNASGGNGQLEYNARRWLGIVGDIGGHYVTTSPNAGAFNYLFGPRLNLRRRRVTPFAQSLFGGLLATDGIGRLGIQNAFAMTAGGGLDISVTRFMAVRPAQADYFMTRFPDGLNNRQNNFRYGAGLVLRLGGK